MSLPVFSLDEIYNGISHESVAVFPFYCIQERGHVIPAVGYIVYRGDGIDTIVVDRSAVDGRFDGFSSAIVMCTSLLTASPFREATILSNSRTSEPFSFMRHNVLSKGKIEYILPNVISPCMSGLRIPLY